MQYATTLTFILLVLLAPIAEGAAGLSRAEADFRLLSPCPGTGETKGPCKGYVVDRIVPIVCGGAEDLANMQWQTIAEAKEKNKWDRIGCRAGRKQVMPTNQSYTEAFPLREETGVGEVSAMPLN